MGFSIWKWLFGKKATEKIDAKTVCFKLANEIMIRELSMNIVANKVANAISKCEFRIYENKKRVKGDEWYRWNVQPNINQNASVFLHKLIHMLFSTNEALVIVINGELFVADSYVKNNNTVLFEHTFTNVVVNNYSFSKIFKMSEVYYFELNSENVRRYLNGTLTLYSGLMNAAYSSYLVANGNKGILKIEQFAENDENFEEYFNKMMNDDFKTFFSSANAVMPLYEGYDYDQLDNKGTQQTTRDFRALLNDVIEITANAYGVPSSIAKGDVQDTSKSLEEMLTFCIDPLVEMIQTEINRKNWTKGQLLNGYCIKIDTLAIKHIDLFDVATSIDKLISSGFSCINDIREAAKMDIIDEPWAWSFFMTKNYSTIEELMNSLKGGGNDEEQLLSTYSK